MCERENAFLNGDDMEVVLVCQSCRRFQEQNLCGLMEMIVNLAKYVMSKYRGI